jgi:hypothetical protein
MFISSNPAEKLIKKQLRELGFGPVHIQRLMYPVQQEPRFLEFLLSKTKQLIGDTCGITHCQISIISCQSNPQLNLEAYLEYYQQLLSYGLNFNLVIELVNYHQPHYLFPLLINHLPKFADLNFNGDDLIYFVYLLESEPQINSMLTYWPILVDLNLTKPEFDDLIHHPEFEKLMQIYKDLLEKGLSPEQGALIFKSIYQLPEFEHYLNCITEELPILHLEKGYNLSSLLKILHSEQGTNKINLLYGMSDKLLGYQFTRDELIHLLDHPQGIFRIKTLAQRSPELKLEKLTPIKIISTVLAEINDPLSVIYQNEMSDYLREIDEEREKYYAEASVSKFLSFFQNKKDKTQEIIECFDMAIEDIYSRSLKP